MKIKFENPPISELVLATYFNPPIFDLKNEHIGLFWSKVRDQFPTVSQQAPVGGVEAFDSVGSEIFPMPRYWFVAEDEINLLQVQKNAFILNWRRRDAVYPHFHEHLKPTFDKYYSIFSDFVRQETDVAEIGIDLCELTYINTIQPCEYWSGPEDTSHVLPSFSVPAPGVETINSPSFNCTYAFIVTPDLQLRVTIRNAVSTAKPAKPEEPVLIIGIGASGRLGQATKSEADPWFDRAHEAIIDCFVGMTNEEIQHKYWKPVEESK